LVLEGTNKNGEVISFKKFEYSEIDNKGNWNKRIEYDSQDSEVPENIVLRQIE
jgi:hypothetical protein